MAQQNDEALVSAVASLAMAAQQDERLHDLAAQGMKLIVENESVMGVLLARFIQSQQQPTNAMLPSAARAMQHNPQTDILKQLKAILDKN